jgi:SAM-dependent methyltransferase
MSLVWKIDECSAYFGRLHLRGWAFHAGAPIASIEAVFPAPATVVPLRSFGQPSADVASAVDAAATHCRFDEWLDAPPEAIGRDFTFRLALADGAVLESGSVVANGCRDEPHFACWNRFVGLLQNFDTGAVIEIGSRARSALTYRQFVPPQLRYTGLDLLPGPNVDVVGDAHELEKLFGREQFVAAFSLSVFEHLAMPWKVALELNRVLTPGGLVFCSTHQTWPLHEEPWDFWRFSSYSWTTIFNAATGFEIVEAVCGEPARIHPLRAHPATRSVHEAPAYLGCAAIARKIADTTLAWPVSTATATRGTYPGGESKRPVA